MFLLTKYSPCDKDNVTLKVVYLGTCFPSLELIRNTVCAILVNSLQILAILHTLARTHACMHARVRTFAPVRESKNVQARN